MPVLLPRRSKLDSSKMANIQCILPCHDKIEEALRLGSLNRRMLSIQPFPIRIHSHSEDSIRLRYRPTPRQ